MHSNWHSNYNVELRIKNLELRSPHKVFSGIFVFSVFFILHSSFFITAVHAQSTVPDLSAQILEKKRAQEQLQQQINDTRAKILSTQKKAATLSNQINLLDSNILKTELQIKSKTLEAEQLALEIQLIESQKDQEEGRITTTSADIGKTLRELNKYDERKYVEVLLAEHSFSEVFDQLYFTERLTNTLRARLSTIKLIRGTLEDNGNLLTEKKGEAEEKKEGLAVMQGSFEQEKRAKAALFGKTKSTEAEFQSLLQELRGAAASIDSEIVTLEKNLREKLAISDKLGTGVLSWPVSPAGGISARFHDPEYPFRYAFEHTGIDIRVPQGTAVHAPASGYVAKVFNGGYGISPSYVMLLHGNNLTTVYMHLSSMTVTANTYVARGDVIGYSGGRPGTSGAGRWSTGSHLHFETRLNGVPLDPMGYLP